jgi:hypothetical protein
MTQNTIHLAFDWVFELQNFKIWKAANH